MVAPMFITDWCHTQIRFNLWHISLAADVVFDDRAGR
jgi:hypothetical protein